MEQQADFWRKTRALTGAFLGIGSSLSLNSFILSTFAPYYLTEFHWTMEQWTWLAVLQMLVMISIPIAGRLTDLFGVWRVAAVGALSFPVFLLAIAFMDGSLTTYFIIYALQVLICSAATSTVYSRVVAQAFTRNRGLALGIAGAGAPAIGALGSPLVSAFVRVHGFQAGYIAVAAFCTVSAVVTLTLLRGVEIRPERRERASQRRGDYREILSKPVFWLMLAATFLVNLPFTVAATQTKLVVTEQGLSDAQAALAVSALGVSAIAGRFVFGLAIDRLSPERVTAFSFALPALGLLILASPFDSFPVVMAAIVAIGLAFGGEGDVIPVLITRHFGMATFSTVLGLMSAAMGASMAAGNILLALTLRTTNSFETYLMTAAVATLTGSLLFLSLAGRRFVPALRPVQS